MRTVNNVSVMAVTAKEEVMVKSIALPTGVTLEYAERGSESGMPVVFLHGVTDSWRSFEPLIGHLPSAVRALSVTQRGHGRSSKPDGGYTYVDLAGDLRAFMDALHLPAAVIVGHSMGSMVAQRFAIDHPDRVAGLVLMGAFQTSHRDPVLQGFWDVTLSTLADPVPATLAREFQLSTIAGDVPAAFVDLAVCESLQVPARVWRALFRGFLDTPDFSSHLRGVDAPALLLWGDRDEYALRPAQDALVATLPNARLVVYEGTGHAIHWEHPRRVAGDVVAFAFERR